MSFKIAPMWSRLSTLLIFLALVFLPPLALPVRALPPGLVVNSTADVINNSCSSTCTLRDAIALSAAGSTIAFSLPNPSTISLTSNTPLPIGQNLTISGPGANALAIDGQSATRVFTINSGTVIISGLTIQHGQPNGAGTAANGGGIYIASGAVLTVNNSTITNNSASGNGGGIENLGTLTVNNSTITNNSASGTGAGIDNSGTLTTKNTTLANNTTITANQAPVFRNGPPPSPGKVGTAYNFTYTFTGFPTPTLNVTAGSLPTGLTLSSAGIISGTPTTTGTFTGTVTATNGVAPDATQNFSIDIDQAPTITNGPPPAGQINVPYTFTYTFTGFPTPTFSVTSGSLPTGLTLSTAGVLSGTPTVSGAFPITVTATNGIAPDATQSFTLNINEPPSITNGPPPSPGLAGTAYNFTYTFTGFPTPTLSVTAGGLPTGLTLSTPGVISGTPTTGGVFTGTVTATNGINPDATQNFSITINAPPIAVTDDYGITAGTSKVGDNYHFALNATNVTTSYSVRDNDTLGFPAANVFHFGKTLGTVTTNAGTLGSSANGTNNLTVNSDGTFTYTAPSATFTGVDSFWYNLQNTAGTSAAVQAFVAVGARPKANNDAYSVTGNIAIQVPVANGTMSNDLGDQISVTQVQGSGANVGVATNTTATGLGGVNGRVTLNADGSFVYDPPTGFTGSDTFTYTITNGFGNSTATVTLTLSNKVWFICKACGGGNRGTLLNPFTSINAFSSVNSGGANQPQNGDSIFIESGTYNAANDNLTLRNNQSVAGQGIAATTFFTVPTSFTHANYAALTTSTRPIISPTGGNGINLASGNSLRAVAVTLSGGTGITGSSVGNLAVVNNGGTDIVTVNATNQVAVNINGGGTLAASFQSISSSGAASGIVLLNTTGSFTISGNGGTCTSAGTCTGGVIQNTTGRGISLTNTQKISIDRMFIQNTANSGIGGTQVVDFTFTNGKIDNSGNTTGGDESNIYFGTATGVNPSDNNVSGVVTITGNTLTNSFEHGVDIQNFAGTITNATISNNVLTSSTSSGTSHGSGIRLLGFGNASSTSNITKATISGNTITNFPGGAGITAQYGNSVVGGPAGTWGTPGDATNVILIQGNFINGQSNANPVGANAILGTLFGVGQANWNIDSNGTVANPITNVCGTAIGVNVEGPNPVATARITNNHIVGFPCVGAQAIVFSATFQVANSDAPHLTGTVSNNVVSGQDGNGIIVLAGTNSNAIVDAAVLNNNVGGPNCGGCNRFGILADSGSANPTVSGVAPNLCLNIAGNTASGSGVDTGIGLRRASNGTASYTFNIKSLPGGDGQSPQLETYINSINPSGGGTTLISATSGFNSCNTAPISMLPISNQFLAQNQTETKPYGKAMMVIDTHTMGLLQVGNTLGVVNSDMLPIQDRSVSGLSASSATGGGLYNTGTATIQNSTFSGNSAGNGGAIDNQGGTLTISNSTFSGNSAYAGNGGGIVNAGTLNLLSTIVAGNTTTGSDPNIAGAVNSLGHNIIGDGTGASGFIGSDQVGTGAGPINPLLGPLASNGGPTQTLALPVNSPAYQTGDCSGNPQDQRFQNRKATCDVGAFEETFTFTPNPLPNGVVGNSYSANSTVTAGGTAPYAYASSVTTLDGLTVTASGSGVALSGIPAAQGVFHFTITVTDTAGVVGQIYYTFTCNSPTATPTNTPTDTPTFTPTNTATNTPTDTATFTPSNTSTNSPTPSNTFTPTNTPTNTPTFTPSNTPTNTATATATSTASNTPTNTATFSPTSTPVPRLETIGLDRGGTFYLKLHNTTGNADITAPFIAGAPIVGDWTGSGIDRVGAVNTSNSLFTVCIAGDNTPCNQVANQLTFVFGSPNDIPFSWHVGNGLTDGPAVYRPSTGTLYFRTQLSTGYATDTMLFGIPGDQPLAGDWSGQGHDTPGLYRPSTGRFYLSNQLISNGTISAAYTTAFGNANGNYSALDGSWLATLGNDGIGLYANTTGVFYLKNDPTTSSYADNSFVFGIPGDKPVAGHWQSVYPPAPPVPVLIPKTAAPPQSNGSVPNNGSIGD